MAPGEEITDLLLAWSDGNQAAFDRLAEGVQVELRKIARAYLRREHAPQTLQPTALINEAYMRLIKQERVQWRNRSHFYGIAAQCMRRVLADYGRRRRAIKRDVRVGSLEEALAKPMPDTSTLGALALAVENLARLDPRQARIVELRVFGGIPVEDVATILEISPATVKRDWVTAKMWLRRELTRDRIT